MRADDLRVDYAQGCVINTQLGGQVAAKIVRHGISRFHKRFELRATFCIFQVERQRLFIAIERLKELTVRFANPVG